MLSDGFIVAGDGSCSAGKMFMKILGAEEDLVPVGIMIVATRRACWASTCPSTLPRQIMIPWDDLGPREHGHVRQHPGGR